MWGDTIECKKLNPKQQAFIDYFIQFGNAGQTALEAGYSKKYNVTKEIIKTAEDIYAILDDDRKTIVQMRYWDKTNCYKWEDIADQLHMSRYRVLRLRNTIIDETARRLAWI